MTTIIESHAERVEPKRELRPEMWKEAHEQQGN